MLSRATLRHARTRTLHVDRARRFAPLALGLAVAIGAVTLTGAATAALPAGATEIGSSATALQAGVPTGLGDAETLRNITEGAEDARRSAEATERRATSIEADVEAAGLDLGAGSTVIDTTDLRARIDQLDASEVLPVLMLPALTEKTVDETARVSALAASLRERLAAAQAQKAAEEAAAAAAAAAQRAAEEAAAQAQREAEAAAAALANANTVDGAKATAQQMASAEYGWGSDQFSCLVSLWNKESGWNYQAYNSGSGATGIPQALPGSKMASAGSDWQTSASTQISWGLQYISSVYGTPCSAWGHSQATDWY